VLCTLNVFWFVSVPYLTKRSKRLKVKRAVGPSYNHHKCFNIINSGHKWITNNRYRSTVLIDCSFKTKFNLVIVFPVELSESSPKPVLGSVLRKWNKGSWEEVALSKWSVSFSLNTSAPLSSLCYDQCCPESGLCALCYFLVLLLFFLFFCSNTDPHLSVTYHGEGVAGDR